MNVYLGGQRRGGRGGGGGGRGGGGRGEGPLIELETFLCGVCSGAEIVNICEVEN